MVLEWGAQIKRRKFTPEFKAQVVQEMSKSEQRVAELERLVERLTMELETAKSLYLLELTLEQRRQVIEMLAETYPVQVACQLLDCARTRYYHQAQARDESQLKEKILQLAGQWPTYDYRRLRRSLNRTRHKWLITKNCVS